QHIEEAGVHSGDSACVIPPHSLPPAVVERIKEQTRALALKLEVKGLMNAQFAIKDAEPGGEPVVYVLEANPRASRTVPFVSKAIGVPLAKKAALIMVGRTLNDLGLFDEITPKHFSVKESVFPFNKFAGVDIILGPEMKSTGEVMGMDADLGLAYAKSQMAAGGALPTQGNLFISVHDAHKTNVVQIAQEFARLGFALFATEGTAMTLKAAGVGVTALFKLSEGRPNVLDMIKNGEIALIINTPSGKTPRADEVRIRTTALQHRVPIMTTLSGAAAAVQGIAALKKHGLSVRSLQEYHGKL
ncbi:MAG: carbamoyl phosphate synthase large subunit, partial [Verrucomicrobiae bacterium]|nr:carbamoyl phosphate synthase large subunit [Verrucomicrobiae bacterium]